MLLNSWNKCDFWVDFSFPTVYGANWMSVHGGHQLLPTFPLLYWSVPHMEKPLKMGWLGSWQDVLGSGRRGWRAVLREDDGLWFGKEDTNEEADCAYVCFGRCICGCLAWRRLIWTMDWSPTTPSTAMRMMKVGTVITGHSNLHLLRMRQSLHH